MRPVIPINKFSSLLDQMIDKREYSSIIDKTYVDDSLIISDLQRAIADIQISRGGRPCILYAGNVISGGNQVSVDASDDTPFQEMVANLPSAEGVDVYLVTGGGSGQQIARFVNCLRGKFSNVQFIIPSFCMSAGTIFALSGNNIWMTPNGCLGPIDPQVPNMEGRFVPAQALLILLKDIQDKGQEAINEGKNPPWTGIRIIDTLDKKELANAITATAWSTTTVATYLSMYKFQNWHTRESSKNPVTAEYRMQRANEIADALASHGRWKSHGHSLSRDVLWDELKLKIDHPDEVFELKIARLWALLNWVFDKTVVKKLICSTNYTYVRSEIQQAR